jgi:hypothetical protein
MAAAHAAPGMFGINKLVGVSVNNIGTGTAIIRRRGLRAVVVNAPIGTSLIIAVPVIYLLSLFLPVVLLLAALLRTGIILTGHYQNAAENENS